MPSRQKPPKGTPWPVIEDVSGIKLAGGWLKLQLSLLHSSAEERDEKALSFEEYSRQIAAEPLKEKNNPNFFVAQDLESPTSLFPVLDWSYSRRGSASYKVGFGSSAPTGREPISHSPGRKSTKSKPRCSLNSWRHDEFEDHPWESWGGMTTRQIRNSPLFKQFAQENPTIFNDLFTPTPDVDRELLDPEKGFIPREIKCGLGIPGVAHCKKRGKTDGHFKSAYETTDRLKSQGRIEAFREATAIKHKRDSWRVISNDDENVSQNFRNNTFQSMRSRRKRRGGKSLMKQLEQVDREVRSGSFQHDANANLNYVHKDFLEGSNKYSLQLAMDMENWEERGYVEATDDNSDDEGNFNLSSSDNLFACSRAEVMKMTEDSDEHEAEPTYADGSLVFETGSLTPRKSALKSRDKVPDDDNEAIVKDQRRARFAEISAAASSSNELIFDRSNEVAS